MTHNRSLAPMPDGRGVLLVCLMAAATFAATGCGSTSQSQVTRLQGEKKELLNRIVDEQKRSETLTAELRDAKLRAAEAEKQLARLYDDPRGRFAGSGVGSTGSYASASRSTGSTNPGGSDFDSPPPVRPQIGLGAPRDAKRDYRAGSDASASSAASPRTSSGRDGSDIADGVGVDLSGPRNGAATPGWVPKAR